MHPAILTQSFTTADPRPFRVYVDGYDIRGDLHWPDLSMEDRGSSGAGEIVMQVQGELADHVEIHDQAFVRVYSYEEDIDIAAGYVTENEPTAAVDDIDRINVVAEDVSGILDSTYIAFEKRPPENMRKRVGFLWGKYRSWHLSDDMTHVTHIGSTLDRTTLEDVSLRAAIEETIFEADPDADYRVDVNGRLHVFIPNLLADMEVVAHRGDINPNTGAPECTLLAMTQARDLGVDKVEFDVMASSSGTLHALHDDTVDRTTDGTGTLVSKTDVQIAALNIDGGFGYDAARHGTTLKIPTVLSILTALSASGTGIQFNIKAGGPTAVDVLDYLVTQSWPLTSDKTEIALAGTETAQIADIRAAYPTVRVLGYFSVGEAIPPGIDGWITQAVNVDAAYIEERRPLLAAPYVNAENDYGTDEGALAAAMLNAGADEFMTNDVPGAQAAITQVLASAENAPFIATADGNAGFGEVAPTRLAINNDSKQYANAVYVNGKTKDGSGLYIDQSRLAAAGGLLRVVSLSASKCRTRTKRDRLARSLLRRMRARPRGEFSVNSPADGWRPGQAILVRRSSFGDEVESTVVSTRRAAFINVVGSRWTYDVRFGSDEERRS